MPAVYVYGVLPAAELGSLPQKGVQGVAVRAIQDEDLVALTSELKQDTIAAAKEVRGHWRVLDEVSKQATILPTRFGTVLDSDQAVRDQLLAPNRERLSALIQRVTGRTQLNVRGDYDEQTLVASIAKRSPQILQLREKLRSLSSQAGYYDSIRLGEMVAAEVQRYREADLQRALELLGPHAVDLQQEDLPLPHSAYKLAFLVERGKQDEFTAAVNRLVAERGEDVEIRYVGPLPPYSFAEADLTQEPAWA